MTRVLFCNPPCHGYDGEAYWWVKAGSRWPFSNRGQRPRRQDQMVYSPYPFFLGFAASYAQQAGADVHFRDSVALRDDYPDFYRYVEELKPEYIVLESATPTWDHDRKVLQTLAALLKGVKLILTGPIVAAHPELASDVHAAVKGEYESGVLRVLKGEFGLIDFDFLDETEMNTAALPWMDEEHAYAYWDGNPKGQRWPHVQTWSSRGCSWKCIFCSWPATMTGNDPDGTHKRTIRHYSPHYLAAWLTNWRGRFPRLASVYDDSDLFNTGDKHTLATAEVYRAVGLPWSAMCRIDSIHRETWQVMKDCGCFGVKIGIETGSQRVMDQIVHKQLDLRKAVETLRHLKKIGINVHTTFMLGLPGETAAESQETLDFLRMLYAEGLTDTHQLSGAASIEGTPLATVEKQGSLAKYPGAVVDPGYVHSADGSDKLRKLGLRMV